MVIKHLLAAFVLGTSLSAAAADFSDADAKFAVRDQGTGTENVLATRAAYKAILAEGVTGDELVRATEGVVRTLIFEGTRFHGTTLDADRAARKTIFSNCLTAVEGMNPEALKSDSPSYYYFKASCIAYKAEVSSPFERLVALGQLSQTVDKGLTFKEFENFEGGGLKRVKAAVLGNPEAKTVPNAYQPKVAKKLIEEAIATPEGSIYCENYRRQVGILVELGDKAGALTIAEQTISDFQSYLADGIIPESIRAETADCIKTVQGQAAGLN
jgi:hypothetical protein